MLKRNAFWVIFSVISGITVAGFSYIQPLPERSDDILYLLSALSQGLAAIFTLVFTISIFGAQMIRNFSSMDEMIDKWTKILMIIFAIGIILPLVQLRIDKDLLNLHFISMLKLSLAIDLGIATFCVLAIIPYLMRVNKIIKYGGGIYGGGMSKIIVNAINEAYTIVEIRTIITMEKFGDIFIDKGWDKPTHEVITHLGELGLQAAEKKSAQTTINAINAINHLGVRAIESEFSDDTTFSSSFYQFAIGIKVMEKNLHFFNKCLLSVGSPKIIIPRKFKLFDGLDIINGRFEQDDRIIVENLMKISDNAYSKKEFLFVGKTFQEKIV